jgi:hypothetical protein
LQNGSTLLLAAAVTLPKVKSRRVVDTEPLAAGAVVDIPLARLVVVVAAELG